MHFKKTTIMLFFILCTSVQPLWGGFWCFGCCSKTYVQKITAKIAREVMEQRSQMPQNDVASTPSTRESTPGPTPRLVISIALLNTPCAVGGMNSSAINREIAVTIKKDFGGDS